MAMNAPTSIAGRTNLRADSILDVGFLSPHVSYYISKHREGHRAMFEIAEELNRLGQRVMAEASVTINEKGLSDPRLITFLLLIRTLSNFQGALLLAERGMNVEARTLARSCYENSYLLAALQKDGDEFVKAMLSDEMHARKGQSRWMLDDPERLRHAPDGVEQMKKNIGTIESTGKTTGLKYDQVTDRAGIADFYIWYKYLSWDAAHPTIQALSRYFSEENGKATLSWGPDCEPKEIGDTVNMCLPAAFGAILICAELLGNGKLHAEGGALWQRYKAMVTPPEAKDSTPSVAP